MYVKDAEEWEKDNEKTDDQLRTSAIEEVETGAWAELQKLKYPPSAAVYLGGNVCLCKQYLVYIWLNGRMQKLYQRTSSVMVSYKPP